MADALQESQREVDAVRRGLEEQVGERTADLLRANEQLRAELSERVKAQEALAQREFLLRLSADIGEALTLEQPPATTLQRGTDVIAREQRPVLTNAVVGDPAITDQKWARREGIVSFAGYPLLVAGRTVGVPGLFARRPLEPYVQSALAVVTDKVASYLARTARPRGLPRRVEGETGAERVRSEAERDLLLAQLQEASFTHGLCPECQQLYFPGLGGRKPG